MHAGVQQSVGCAFSFSRLCACNICVCYLLFYGCTVPGLARGRHGTLRLLSSYIFSFWRTQTVRACLLIEEGIRCVGPGGALDRGRSGPMKRMPALDLRRLAGRPHVVPVLELLATRAALAEAQPADQLAALLAHRRAPAVVDRQVQRYVSQLEQGNLPIVSRLIFSQMRCSQKLVARR